MSSNNLYIENILNDIIIISGNEINTDIDTTVIFKLKTKIGDKCIKDGYVDKESIQIIERTIGTLISQSFDGSIKYHIKYSADICNPFKGQIVTASIKNVSKMGIILEKKPLEIILARQHHQDKSIFDSPDYNKDITVEIMGRKFDLNDDKIICIGKIVN